MSLLLGLIRALQFTSFVVIENLSIFQNEFDTFVRWYNRNNLYADPI